MGRIDRLAERYKSYIVLPWQKDLAGAQRAIFVVYDKNDERRLRARLDQFEMDYRGRSRLAEMRSDQRFCPMDDRHRVPRELFRLAGRS